MILRRKSWEGPPVGRASGEHNYSWLSDYIFYELEEVTIWRHEEGDIDWQCIATLATNKGKQLTNIHPSYPQRKRLTMVSTQQCLLKRILSNMSSYLKFFLLSNTSPYLLKYLILHSNIDKIFKKTVTMYSNRKEKRILTTQIDTFLN